MHVISAKNGRVVCALNFFWCKAKPVWQVTLGEQSLASMLSGSGLPHLVREADVDAGCGKAAAFPPLKTEPNAQEICCSILYNHHGKRYTD
jgi:hypothetical protein